MVSDPEVRKIPQQGVPGPKGRPAGIAGRMVNSPLTPVGLGVLSVVASLAIGYFAYQHSLASGAQRLRQFYLSKARMLVAGTGPLARLPDSELLAAVELLWNDSGTNAPDEYLCIIDKESILLLHTARPETKGHFVGDNVVLSDGAHPTCRVRDLTKSREDRVGGYVSSEGQDQIAAFASFPQRKWMLGVHRSKAAFDAEVRAGFRWIGFAFLGVCGLLLPVSLIAIHRTMRRLERRRERADTALRESETRFRQLVENIHEVFWMEDAAGTELLYVSPAYEQIWGRSCREFYENPGMWTEAIHAEDRQRVVDAFGQFRETGTYSEEFRIVRPDGSIRWIWDRGVLIHDESGRVHRVAGIAEDVTDRRRIEEALRESNRRLSRAQHVSKMGFLDWNMKTNNMYWSKEVYRIYGIDPEKTRSTLDLTMALVHPDDRECLEKKLELSLAGEETYNVEHRIVRPDGNVIWVHAQAELSRDAAGEPERLLGTVVDITDRKWAENQQRLTQFAVDHSADPIYWVRADGGIAYANDAASQSLGYTRDELTSMSATQFDPDFPADAWPAHWRKMKRAGSLSFEAHHRTKAGRVFPVEIYTNFVVYDGQEYVWAYARDITERRQAEEKLREGSELLEAVHEANPDLQFVLASDGTITSYHARDEADLSESPKNFIGKTMADVLPAEVGEQFQATFDTASATGSLVTIEYTLPMPDGEHSYEGRIVPLPDQRLVVTVRDITERKRAEAEREHLLHDTGERVKELRCMYGVAESIRKRDTLEQVFEDVVALIPPGWQYPRITRARIRFDDREFVSQPFEETQWRQSADIVIGGEIHGTIDVFYTEECIEWDEGPFLEEERDLIDGLARALSEAIEHEDAEKSRDRLATAIEQAEETIVITDADGTIQYANPVFERTSGYSCKEAVGRNPRILKSGKHDEAFYKEMWETISGGKTWEGRIINRKKDGSLYTEDASISPVVDNEGKIVNYIAVKRDVTKVIELEDQLRQAQKMEAVAQLASGVAHDFNNLLTVINGYVSLAKGALPKNHKAVDLLSGVQEAAEQASGVTRSLLTFSHKTGAKKEPVELRASVEKSLRLLRHVLPAGIEVLADTAGEPVWVQADGTQLQQVIMNLAINARNAMPDGGTLRITVSQSAEEPRESTALGEKGGLVARLVVSDTGTGMERDVRERIFEPFFTTKPRGQGTGLGLAIIHSIVEDHDGRIHVASEPGRGTTFTIELPILEVDPSQVVPEEATPPRRGRGKLVLLAEDNRHVRGILTSALESLDYEVVQANDGSALMDCFERHRRRIELLVVDVDLPKRSGPDCLREIRSYGSSVPAIVITGSADASLENCLDEDTTLLRKPFQIADFTTLAGNVLAAQHVREEKT